MAISVVLSSFTGFLIFAVGDAGQATSFEDTGDLYIGEDYGLPYKHVRGGLPLTGDLYIRSGGVLIIDGGSLEFMQEYVEPGHPTNRISTLIIEDGGKLVLRNATLTSRIINVNVTSALPSLGILVRNGGVFEAYDSTIMASGHLVVDDSTFNLTRSKVVGFNDADVKDHCDQALFPSTDFDDSLVMLFMSSRVNLIESSIEDVFESDNEDGSEMFSHNYGFVNDVNAANGTRLGASYMFYRMPSKIANDAPTGPLDDLTKDDLKSYVIGAQERLWLDGFDAAGMMFSSDDDVELKLNIEYNTSSDPSDISVSYMYRNGVWADTGMVLEATPVDPVSGVRQQRTATWALQPMSAQDLHGLNIEIDNAGAGTIEVDRVWVSIALTLDTYRNITIAGNTDFTAVDTYIGVDQSNDAQKKNRMVLMDDSQAYLYGIYIDGKDTPSLPLERKYPFVMVESTFQATAGEAGENDNTGEKIGNTTHIDDRTYKVGPNKIIHLTEFETVEIRGTVLDATASFNYVVGSIPYSQDNYIQWSIGGIFQNSTLNPTSESYSATYGSFNLSSHGLSDMASINELSIQFVNGDPDTTIEFNRIWLDITISPTVYIYRWADITVEDSRGQMVNGAEVHAVLQSTDMETEAYYYTAEGAQDHPADEVLKCLGKTVDDFNVTGPDGKVRIPYLAEVRNLRVSNPYLNMTYRADVTFKSELWGDDSKSLTIEFRTYMALSKESASMEFNVVLDNLLIRLPDLSIEFDDVQFSSWYVMYGNDVTAYILIRNQGELSANNVLVEAYDGAEPLGTTTIDVPMSGSATASITWNTGDRAGDYPISFFVNRERTLLESNYANNEASKNITIGLPVEGEDLVIGGTAVPSLNYTGILDAPYNVRIIENGTLTVNGGVLRMFQSGLSNFMLSISGNGTLKLIDGATFTSNTNASMVLNGDGTLLVRDSGISGSVNIMADGRSNIAFDNAQIGPSVDCPLDSRATVTAINTTFVEGWDKFGGHAVAHLTDVAMPFIGAVDDATIYIYSWMSVTVWDGSGQPGGVNHVLPGATVDATYPNLGIVPDGFVRSHIGMTDGDGKVLFQVLRTKLTQDNIVNMGSMFIRANYIYGGQPYYDDFYRGEDDRYTAVSQGGYYVGDSLVRGVFSESLHISSAKPDLDPPIYFSNDKPARGQTVLIWAHIVNNGPVDAHSVGVLFKDNTTGKVLYNEVISVVPRGGQANAVNVSLSWTATYPIGEHEISLSVDPDDVINEVDETNNNNTRSITVRGIADLVVGPGDITFDPATLARERPTTISVRVTNQGDVKADNVNVSVYAIDPLGQRRLIGTQFINALMDGASASISLSWAPALAGSHTIQVIVDGEEKIEDINRGNNNAQVVRSVLDFPDLWITHINLSPPSPVAVNDEIAVTANVMNVGGVAVSNVVVNFYLNEISTQAMFGHATISSIPAGGSGQARVYLTASLAGGVLEEDQTIIAVVNPDQSIREIDHDNNNALQKLKVTENRPDIIFTGEVEVGRDAGPAGSAAIGEKIYISTHAKNNGTTPAYDVLFAFYAVDGMGMGTEIGRLYKHVGIGQEIEINITWTVNMTMGSYTLAVISNADGALEEIDDTENIVSVAFIVEAPNTKITFDKLPGPSYEPGRTVLISGKVTNSNTNGAVVGADVEVWLEKDGQKVSELVNGTTRSDGTFEISLHLRQGLDGQYRIVVNASIGGKTETTSQLIQVKAAPEGGIPWYAYLLIFALVSAVIIAFSAYLYKYGLGRMVECGECAALIPEASKRCPKCGVQFEPGTAKCSECSAWIPSNSTQCPECGTKFITEAINEEEDAHIKRMREQYESYVETYREEAKIEMGRKYTDARFPTWWKKHPAFISFEQWLSQEEEKLKSGGTLCPVCGIHNPRGSPICQKCGSTLEAPKSPAEPAKDAPPRKPLRRIVRRPVPGTGKDKPASPGTKAPEESADKAVPAQAEEKASDEAPKP